MYFSLSHTKHNTLPFHYNINGKWLSTAYDLSYKTFYGYRLSGVGGNFVEFNNNQIHFSYLKDFKLMKNDNVLLTNLEIEGEYVPNDIVTYNIDSGTYVIKNINIANELDYDYVRDRIAKTLTENIMSCTNRTDPKIVYTAGLDSGLTAYIAHQHNVDFTCVTLSKYQSMFKNLPFKRIRYSEIQFDCGFEVKYGRKDNIREGLYQPENNELITGYFGDNVLLHHIDLFYQTKHLHSNPEAIELYDKRKPNNYPLLNSKQDILNAVLHFNRACYHRQWFDTFEMLDPYRDPRLFELVLSLPLNNLIEQFGSAKIQKDILKSMNMEWYNNLCDYKNDYTKFLSK